MSPSPRLDQLQVRLQRGELPGLDHLKIQTAELEVRVDSLDEVGLRAWLVIDAASASEEPTRAGTHAAAAAVTDVARELGYQGFCEVVYASPEEAERLPSRRAGAAA